MASAITIVTECSNESGEKRSILVSIENQSDTIPNRQESGDDSDSELESPAFPFEYRGKPVANGSGPSDNSAKRRPSKDKKGDEAVKADEKKAKEAKGKGKDGKK